MSRYLNELLANTHFNLCRHRFRFATVERGYRVYSTEVSKELTEGKCGVEIVVEKLSE